MPLLHADELIMKRAAQLPRQPGESLQRLSTAVQRNIDDAERRIAQLEKRIALLEARDLWFRLAFYPYLQGLAVAVPYAMPPSLPR